MNEQVAANPLGTERVGKLMIRYAIPSIISIVVNSLYNMVDQIFIGQGVGYLGNAATNVIMPLTTILLALGMMIGDGTASYMSLNLGRGRSQAAAYGVGNAVILTVGVSVFLLLLFELFLEPLCHLFGATEGNLPYALEYGSIIVLGFPLCHDRRRVRQHHPSGWPTEGEHGRSADRLYHQHHSGPHLHLCVPLGCQRRSLGHHHWADFERRLFHCVYAALQNHQGDKAALGSQMDSR